MSEAKHTPGPWHLGGYFHPDRPDIGTWIWSQPAPGMQSVVVVAKEVCPANAHLIAAAPELLAALKRLQASVFQSEPHEPNCGCCYHEASAAIAKAEGRS